MADWRNQFRGPSRSGKLIHPDAPAGGSGLGSSRSPRPIGVSSSSRSVPHPDSPAGLHFDWTHELPLVDTAERAAAVYRAIKGAGTYTPQALREATGQELHDIVAGLVPGLLLLIGILAATTALGAAAGAAIGALAGGIGAIPGAAVGAGVGFDLGVAILDYLGLAFLAVYVGKSLIRAVSVAGRAVRMAWDSVDDERSQALLIDRASRRLALAVALVFRGILQGIVAFLLAKGTAAAAERVPEVVAKLRSSRLGAVFADWVQRNWQRLIAEPRLKDTTVPGTKSAGAGAAGTQPTASNQPLKVARRVPEKSANTQPAPSGRTWGNPATLNDHFARHGRDFGSTSPTDYANSARQFYDDAGANGYLTKTDANGVTRIYDPKTNTFGSYNADGSAKTFYKPDPAVHGYPTNMDYWNAQPPKTVGGSQ